MENSFKQLLIHEETPEKEVKDDVFRNIHLKGFLLSLLEMFTAIFGITATHSVILDEDKLTPKVQKQNPASRDPKDSDLSYFF